MRFFLLALLVSSVVALHSYHSRFVPPRHRPPVFYGGGDGFQQHPSSANCTVHYYTQRIDHFGWNKPCCGVQETFQQRYFVCDSMYRKGGPVFFYTGNEADVELYVNATGLMWDNAEQFGAVLIFAEHRYYGKSRPIVSQSNDEGMPHLEYLSSEQALADFAELLKEIKPKGAPVIAFGGSYGGMLASWMRMKYPHVIDGAISASAPIVSFLGQNPPCDENSFAKIVTQDASAGGGAPDSCADNIRKAWQVLFKLGQTSAGRNQLTKDFKLCANSAINTYDNVWTLAYWAQSAYDYMSMGNYPYPTSYILNGNGVLPAFPMRVACSHISASSGYPTDTSLMEALRESVGVYYNYTHSLDCFDFNAGANNESRIDALQWDFQFCTEMVQPQSRNGVADMFFNQPFNLNATIKSCQDQWGVTPRPYWANINYGGWKIASRSNILFSNGDYDPWSGTGITRQLSDDLPIVMIKGAAHHLDLFFKNAADPKEITQARQKEVSYIAKWIEEANQKKK